MFGRVGVLLVLLVVLVLLGVRLAPRSRRRLEPEPSRQDPVLAGHRKAVGWRWAGVVLGVAAAARLATSLGSLGLGLMLAPTVFGLCVIGGVVVGELATTPGREGVRTAALETRTVGGYLPWRLGAVVTASTLGLGALLVTTTLMASVDDMGRASRSLVRQCSPGLSASSDPWPGLFYSVPLAIVVLVGLLGAAVALRTVVLRPRSGSASELPPAAADALRRRSAEAVVAATGVMVAASLFGISLNAGGALIGFACPPTSWTALGFSLLAVGALMLVLAVWCLVVLLSGPRIRPMASADNAVDDRSVPR